MRRIIFSSFFLLSILTMSSSSADLLSTDEFCLAMIYSPDFINEEIYEQSTAMVIDARIEEEIERGEIELEMAVFFKNLFRTDGFKQLLLDQGEIWCEGR